MLRAALFHWKLEVGNWKLNKGFTLVEILVVIAIIGFLSTAGLTSYIASQRNGRDARRRTDLETIRQALELFKSDNSAYPAGTGDTETSLKSALSAPTAYISSTSFPKDPQSSKGVIYYYEQLTNTTYRLCTLVEDLKTGDPNCPVATYDCDTATAGTQPCNYGVTQP